MNKRKLFALLLALVMVLSFAACGNGNDDSDNGGEGNTETTDPLKVGFIYIGSINDGGYTQAQHEGTLAMAEHFGDEVEAKWVENVDDEDKQAALDAATNLIDQGCKVVVGCSYGFMDALDELANSGDYDDIDFLHFSGSKMNDTNFGNYFGAMEEPRYLSGMVAGLMTETNKLGYVGAYSLPEVNIGINAFTLGAQSVNPDIEVNVVYINSWYDPETERTAADQLLDMGCDVITQHTDTTGPLVAAQEKGAYAIGYDLDNREAAPEAYLTAPVWHLDKFLIPTIEDIMAGTWEPESYYGSMADGFVSLAPMTDLVPEEVQNVVAEVEKEMVAGTFKPFSGYIEYADGTVLCEEGQTLTREEIWQTTQLIKGASK